MTIGNAKRGRTNKLRWAAVLAVVLAASGGVLLLGRYAEPGFFAGQGQYERRESATGRQWAQQLDVRGVPNLYKVSDELYRGAQPSMEGMRELKQMGVRTIVNLRTMHSDRDELKGVGLMYEHLPFEIWKPQDEEVVRFLRIVTDPNLAPVFVHCQRGADRTGTMCAMYRIVVQGWDKEEAIEEMTRGGFGFYEGWKNLMDYIREADIEEMKKHVYEGRDGIGTKEMSNQGVSQ